MDFRIVDEYGKYVLKPTRDSEVRIRSYETAALIRNRIRDLSGHNYFIEAIRG